MSSSSFFLPSFGSIPYDLVMHGARFPYRYFPNLSILNISMAPVWIEPLFGKQNKLLRRWLFEHMREMEGYLSRY